MDINSVALQISNIATASALHAWALIGNFLIVLVLTLLMIGFSYYGGRGGIISLQMSFYVGYKALLSVVLFIIASFIPYMFINRLIAGGFGILSFVPRFVLSFLAATFLLALAYHVFNVTHIYTFPEPMNSLFAPDQFFFWWFIAPLAGLFFLVH
jgi:hypothetical protein